jgi:O-antigen ligase
MLQANKYYALLRHRYFHLPILGISPNPRLLQPGLVLLSSFLIGGFVIIATYYADNLKLLVGLIGGIAFVLLTMKWPELGILSYVALLSGLVPLSSLPALHFGPISLQISDAILIILLGLLFVRATAQPNFSLFSSPMLMPLLLFIGAFLISAICSYLLYGVNLNTILRTLRVLILWIMFIPTLQLVRDERSLRRFLSGLLVFTFILLIGVLFPNRFSPILYVEQTQIGLSGQMYADATRIYFAGDMILYAMIPVTVASLAITKKRNQFWRIGLLGLLVYWAVRTYFREYWLTLAVICCILFLLLKASERARLIARTAPVLFALVFIGIILFSVFPGQTNQILSPVINRINTLRQNPLNEASLQWRLIESDYALQSISQHPILGIGLSNTYRPPMASESDITSYEDWTSRYIENGYLYIALYMGLVGLIPFLILCMIYLIRSLQYQNKIMDDDLRAVYLGFGLAFLGMLACNIFSPTFVFGTRLIFFPVAMAISEIILRLEREKNRNL